MLLKFKNRKFYLTDLGVSLIENIGAILLPFKGYNQLFAKQYIGIYIVIHAPSSLRDNKHSITQMEKNVCKSI